MNGGDAGDQDSASQPVKEIERALGGALRAGLVASALTSILALSILFGRTYFLSYHEALGIPSSAIKVNLLEYAIFSPDVTIASIGIVFGMALLLYMTTLVAGYGSIRRLRDRMIVLALGAFCFGSGLGGSVVTSTEILLRLPLAGTRGLLIAAFFLLFIFGSVLISYAALGDGLPVVPKWLVSVRLRGLTKLAVVVVSAIIVTYGVFDYIHRFAAADAEHAKSGSPKAVLVFSHSLEIVASGLAEASQRTLGPVRVILENDGFIYVVPVTSPDVDTHLRIIAIPKNDLQSIQYLSDENP